MERESRVRSRVDDQPVQFEAFGLGVRGAALEEPEQFAGGERVVLSIQVARLCCKPFQQGAALSQRHAPNGLAHDHGVLPGDPACSRSGVR